MGPVPSRTDESVSRTSLPSNALAAGGARRFVRSVLAGRTAAAAVPERIVDDALLLVSELVTNALMHAGTDIEVVCRLQAGPVPPVPAAPERAGTGAAPQHRASGWAWWSRWLTGTPPAWCAPPWMHSARGVASDFSW